MIRAILANSASWYKIDGIIINDATIKIPSIVVLRYLLKRVGYKGLIKSAPYFLLFKQILL